MQRTCRSVFLAAVLLVPSFAFAQTTCPTLSMGSSGASVTAVQKILHNAYSNFPTPTGYFGNLTRAALEQWQEEHGIESTGTVGPKTAAAMKLCTNVAASGAAASQSPVLATSIAAARTLVRGMSGTDVTTLQQQLVSLGLLTPNSATGFYGALTEAAVRKFQLQKGIVTSGTPATTGYGAVGPRTRASLNAGANKETTLPSSSATAVPTANMCPLISPAPVKETCPSGAPWQKLLSTTGCQVGWQCGPSVQTVNTTLPPASKSNASSNTASNSTNNATSGSTGNSTSNTTLPVPSRASCDLGAGRVLTHGASVVAYLAPSVAFGETCKQEVRRCDNGNLSGTYTNTACSVAGGQSCVFAETSITHGNSVVAYREASVPNGQSCVSETRTCTNGSLSGSYTKASCVTIGATQCAWEGQSIASGTSITAYELASVPHGDTCKSETRICTNGIFSGTYGNAQCTVQPPVAAASCAWEGRSIESGSSITAYQLASVPYGQTCRSESRTCSNGRFSGTFGNASCVVEQPPFCTDCVSVRIGPPTIVRGPFSVTGNNSGDELDGPFNLIKLATGLFRGFSTNSRVFAIDGATVKQMGGQRTLVLDTRTPDGPDECGNWLFDTEMIGGVLYGFMHNEKGCRYENNNQTHKSMSLAKSMDNGLSWTKLGTIIEGPDSPASGQGTGEGDCTAVNGNDGYLYLYCLRLRGPWRTIVARAPVSNIGPGNWIKWDGSGWNNPGIGGESAALNDFPALSAAYWKEQDVFMLAGQNQWFGGTEFSFSKDKVHFTKLQEPLILTEQVGSAHEGGDFIGYPALINPIDGTDRISNSFVFSYTYVPGGTDFTKRYLVMHDMQITMGATTRPQVRLALSTWKGAAVTGIWTTTGPVIGNGTDYVFDKTIGYLMTTPDKTKASVKLDECVDFWPGHPDHMITSEGTCGEAFVRTAGWAYADSQPGTIPLYRCYAATLQSHFASTDANCEGNGTMEWLLGYILQ